MDLLLRIAAGDRPRFLEDLNALGWVLTPDALCGWRSVDCGAC